jgi:hypothetical protein
MILHVLRSIYNPEWAKGVILLDGKWLTNSHEDTVRELKTLADKVFGKTAIPAGVYEVIVTDSPKFKKKMTELVGVPFFSKTRIHGVRDERDTEGCVGHTGGPAMTDMLTQLALKPGKHFCHVINGYPGKFLG